MNDRSYTKAIERELIRVAKLVSDRQREARLKDISSAVSAWKKKRLSADNALNEVRRIVQAVPPPWSDQADPGVPVAQGISEGLVTRKDLSPQAWKAIEVLIAVAEV